MNNNPPNPTPSVTEELKPCPFCGGRGEPCNQRWMNRDHWGVVCQGSCGIFYDERADTKPEAVVAWNRRFGDHPLVQMVEMDEKLGLLADAPEANADLAMKSADQPPPHTGPTVESLQAAVERAAKMGPAGRPALGAMTPTERDKYLFGQTDVERAFDAALSSLNWRSNPSLVEAANRLRDDGFNNAKGHMSNYMAGRFLDAYSAARAAIAAMQRTGND